MTNSTDINMGIIIGIIFGIVFVLILVIFIVLTLTSIVFRGEGMALAFPWN